MPRAFIAAGALLGLLSVALSAYAAHGLSPEAARLAGTALTQGGWHALALILTGILAERWGGRLLVAAGACFLLGTVLFCGGVLFVALRGVSPGPVAPVGGTLLMLGWLLLAVAALTRRPSPGA
ncbi:DUF423 domain-containing protein [Roseomonas sp. CCTCC AB2023176]|uniref:DUF423 domain-containing protein n=1 Tax=Roseomonas sp. CCTCC AB2023176 TaxID=3342640 RepID=UPI0035DFB18C